ncbi:fam-a protein [Plasmodium yoelii yoelii]|uniref:Fam-a protein n=1 Tax=Plasmodium yoelii yoelii TaxID=73239 RepID=A0AAE9WU14_PLAYO|nr:fam-a protein [Plasmodium yoelii yoelii]
MNKFYIQIVLFLLSTSLYMNNKTLAIEPAPGEDATPESPYHYLTMDGYEFFNNNPNSSMPFYNKKHQDYINIEKIHFKVDDPDDYNEVINMLWDPDYAIFSILTLLKRYFYALATKVEISENKAIIVMASANIIDHNHKNKKYFENKIIENANLFQAEIDSEDDIRKGKLKKTLANLIGYLIEKRDRYIHIIYVDSIERHSYGFLNVFL